MRILAVSFILSSVVHGSLAGCPPNYEIINDICFGLRTAAHLDWEQADKLCHQDHTRLARVDPDQLPLLLKILPRGARAWIGLRYDKTLHKWLWTKDHSSADVSLPYLGSLDSNATEEDDCALIRMKKNVLRIETDTCADKWINAGLCAMEKESCGYSTTQSFSQCEFDGNETCTKKAVYDIDGGSLPRHANECQVDDVDCRVVFNDTYGDSISCSVECGENVGKNDTISVSDDCKRVMVAASCDCVEAEAAMAKAAAASPKDPGLYIGVSMLAVIIVILIIGVVSIYMQKRRKCHSERIYPPPPTTCRYTVDPVGYRSDTAAY